MHHPTVALLLATLLAAPATEAGARGFSLDDLFHPQARHRPAPRRARKVETRRPAPPQPSQATPPRPVPAPPQRQAVPAVPPRPPVARPAPQPAAAAPAAIPLPVPRPASQPAGTPAAVPPAVAPAAVEAAPPQPGTQPAPPTLPTIAPGAAPVLQADASCPARLSAAGIMAESVGVPAQADARCTVPEPVRLRSLRRADGSTIAFPDGPLVACAMAERFGQYVSEMLDPLAHGTYGSRLAKVSTGPGLECRSRDSIPGAKLSAHGNGLALDIADLTLESGRSMEVGRPTAETDKRFETAARAGGCGYFHTELGPGSDSFHETHWHFDILPRGKSGDSKFCQ